MVGHKENGDSIFRYIYADTQKELTAKLRQNIDIYFAKLFHELAFVMGDAIYCPLQL